MPIEIQDSNLLPKDFSVFYCWQDHLDKKLHRFLIRDALNAAIARVQNDLPENAECILRQDSDTLDRAGSVDIANTILQKINDSTVVVGDVTPVLIDSEKDRFYPNPNVMIELGYAGRSIGWNRVICLFNQAVCHAEKLPFDIKHRRVTPYRCANLAEKKEASLSLENILFASLRAILQEVGRGELDPSLSDTVLRHQRDLRLLKEVMVAIHRPTLDRFVARGQVYQIHYDCLFFWHGFDAIVSSNQFRFYDQELQRRVLKLHQVWEDTLNYGSAAFSPGTTPGSYVLKPGQYWNDEYRETLRLMEKSYTELPHVLNDFLDWVHFHFVEIDMDQTDNRAWEINLPYIRGDAFGDQNNEEGDGEDSTQ